MTLYKVVHAQEYPWRVAMSTDRPNGEIAIITRAAAARMLGLKDKGNLGPGANANITLNTPGPDKRAIFELPRFVIKAGEVLV